MKNGEIKNLNLVFKKFNKILNSTNLNVYFIGGGSLLGIIREKKFLKFDDDIDFETLSSELRTHKEELIKIFRKKGFLVKYKSYNGLYPKLNFFKSGIKISLGSFEEKNSIWAVSRINKMPIIFFKKIKKIKFMGTYVNVPKNHEKYLRYVYNNWKIEDRSGYFYKLEYYRHDTFYTLLYKIRRILHLIRD